MEYLVRKSIDYNKVLSVIDIYIYLKKNERKT